MSCHVMRVSLQELMDIVFDQTFPVVGDELPARLAFKNIVFVMEDIDAASPIVLCRDRRRRPRGTKTTVKVRLTLLCSRFARQTNTSTTSF